jgi:hypothetical protein
MIFLGIQSQHLYHMSGDVGAESWRTWHRCTVKEEGVGGLEEKDECDSYSPTCFVAAISILGR